MEKRYINKTCSYYLKEKTAVKQKPNKHTVAKMYKNMVKLYHKV